MSRTECSAVSGSCSLGELLQQCPASLRPCAVLDWHTSQSLASELVCGTGTMWEKPWLDAAVVISAAIDPGHQ